jgi:branched-chain amino acid transport system permease protein
VAATEVPTAREEPSHPSPLGWLQNPHVRFAQLVACGVLGLLLFTEVLWPAPIGVLILGAIDGSLLALLAVGLVLIYRANRIINFAQADLGAVGGLLGVLLIAGPHVPFFLAMFIGVATAVAIGALTEFLFVRRFAKAPRLILTVATIGIAQICAGGELLLPKPFGRDITPQIKRTPLDFFHFRITKRDPILFGGSHLLAVLVVTVATGALIAFFRYTRIGIAVRGAAESSERAEQLGVPVKWIGTLVWVIAAILSALALFLKAPIAGVPIGSVVGPQILLGALAAAIIGRMENLPVTFGAAVVIGVLQNATKYATGRGTLADAILFAIIMGAFLLQRRGRVSRADESGASSWSLIKEVRPIPRELVHLPEVRIGLKVVGGLFAAALVIVPLFLKPLSVNLLFEQGAMFAMIGISLVVLTGWAGEISIGQVAFFALGAATAAKLGSTGWNFFLCLLAAGLVGAGASLVIGIPSLRIRGPFLAVATLGLAITTSSFFLDPHYFPWFVIDNRVFVERPLLFGKFDSKSEYTYYFVLLAVLALVLLSVRSFKNSRAGRVLVASRDNPRAAQSFGVNVTAARLWAFVISGFIAAMAGGLFAFQQDGLSRTFFAPEQSFVVFTLIVVGGLGSVSGALLGAIYYATVSYLVKSQLGVLFVQGSGLLLILLVLPGGFGGALYDARDAALRWVAKRRGIVVASMMADRRTEEQAFAEARAGTSGVEVRDPNDTAELVAVSSAPPAGGGDEA